MSVEECDWDWEEAIVEDEVDVFGEEPSGSSDDGENVLDDSQDELENISLLRQEIKVDEDSDNISEKHNSDEQQLLDHTRVQTEEKPFPCNQCGKNYSNNKSLKNHLKSHEVGYRARKTKPYPCSVCGKTFSKAIRLKYHENTSHNIQSIDIFRCEFCQKVLSDKQTLVVHKRVHTGEKPFNCDGCGNNYISNKSLKNHQKTHEVGYQGTQNQKFPCNICGKAFAKASRLKDHENTHTGETPYECVECGLKFSRSETLRSHIVFRHVDDPTSKSLFSCEVCQKVFRDKRKLMLHMRVHTGEKPFSCELCGKSFSRNDNFVTHLKTHSGERPYSCELCGKNVQSKNSLRKHRKTHVDGYVPKPYQCNICGKDFDQAARLKDHEFMHAGKTPYQCEVCGLQLGCKDKMRRHKKKDHEGLRLSVTIARSVGSS